MLWYNVSWQSLGYGGEKVNKYKAVFFDRDGTLTMNDKRWERLRNTKLTQWSGRPFEFTDELFMKHFTKVREKGYSYKDVQEEILFFKEWYKSLFDELDITVNVNERVEYLVEHLWYMKKQLYSETIEVLEYFKSRGYLMGVISDSPPSLERTLEGCGIHKYFVSFTASSIAGAGKPSPIIYNTALESVGVSASDSLYIDDRKNEAEGARNLGFTSFWLDRTKKNRDKWTAHNLSDLIRYVEGIYEM